MLPAPAAPCRPLLNEATGIDLLVPLFQEVRGSMMTGHVEYQIVVVTRLAAFKSPKHRPADVVQLVVRNSSTDPLAGSDPRSARSASPFPTHGTIYRKSLRSERMMVDRGSIVNVRMCDLCPHGGAVVTQTNGSASVLRVWRTQVLYISDSGRTVITSLT